MSSDESDFEIEDQYGQEGYKWEPEYTEEELAAIESKKNETSEHEVNARGANLDWCTCSMCTIMPSFTECICCQEFGYFSNEQYLSYKCVTGNPEFDLICLNTVVLETAYVAFLRYKRETERAPDSLSPKQSRLMAYRQFVNWVRRGQPLGKKCRIVIPSCVVTKIRKSFPDPEGNYEGFHEASSSESESD